MACRPGAVGSPIDTPLKNGTRVREPGSVNGPRVKGRNDCLVPGVGNPRYATGLKRKAAVDVAVKIATLTCNSWIWSILSVRE